MKKKQLAVAVAGALATLVSVPALAQVTMSGNIDVTATSSIVNTTKMTDLSSGMASTSKLIIQGTEDLGGGLKARFYTETGLTATKHLGTGYASSTASSTNNVNSEKTSTAIGDRGIYVGVMGGFGSFDMGRIPHITGTAALGMGGVQNALSNATNAGNAHPGQNADVLLSSQKDGRANSSLLFTSPNMNGFTAKVQHSLGGGDGDGSQGNRTSLNANYTKGDLAVEWMSSKKKAYDVGSLTEAGATPAATGSYSVYAAGSKIQETAVGLKYDLKVVVLGIGWAKQTSTTAAGATTEFSANGLSATVPIGAWSLSLGTASITPASTQSYSAYSAGAQYALSKRTSVYGGTRRNNQVAGKDSLNYFGVNHTF